MNNGLPNGVQPTSSNAPASMQQQNYSYQHNGPTMYAAPNYHTNMTVPNMEQAMNSMHQMNLNQQQHNYAQQQMHQQQQMQAPPNYMNANYGGWNVHAAEFVPRSTNQTQQYGNYMQQHAPAGPTWQQQMAMQQQQQQFDPYNTMQFDASWMNDIDSARLAPQVQHSEAVSREMHGGPHAALLMEVQVGLEQLMSQPDEADIWTEAILTRLTQPRTVDIGVQQLVNQMIFETAAAQPLSAYILAVLLGAMVAHQQLAESFLVRCVVPYCRQEHERRFQLLQTDIGRLRNYALFMAELYLRLQTRTARSRVDILAVGVCEQVECLMSNTHDDENVLTAARMVKTVGRALCEDNPDRLDELINDLLRPLAASPPPELGEPTRKQLTSVLTLHDNKWGLARSTHNSSTTEPASPVGKLSMTNTSVDEAGVPTTNEHELSVEERKFIEDHLAVGSSNGNEAGSVGNGHDKSSDTEDEVSRAYDEFLKTQERQ